MRYSRGYSWAFRDYARCLHVHEGLSFADIAEEVGVSVATIRKWATDDVWAKRREEHLLQPYREVDLLVAREEMRLKYRETGQEEYKALADKLDKDLRRLIGKRQKPGQ